MTVRNLEHLFHPKSVAVIGASAREHSVGATVLSNLLESSYSGTVMAVNPKSKMLSGMPVYARVRDLPIVPELAIICTPPSTIPRLIDELGEFGTKAAIVLSAGLTKQEVAAMLEV